MVFIKTGERRHDVTGESIMAKNIAFGVRLSSDPDAISSFFASESSSVKLGK